MRGNLVWDICALVPSEACLTKEVVFTRVVSQKRYYYYCIYEFIAFGGHFAIGLTLDLVINNNTYICTGGPCRQVVLCTGGPFRQVVLCTGGPCVQVVLCTGGPCVQVVLVYRWSL